MVTVYHYPACSTCKKALKWLAERGVSSKQIHIVDDPPSKKILASLLKETGLPVAKLFNTSGQLYREGGYKDRLKTMSDSEALDELASHGKLIKRPLVLGTSDSGKKVHLVGFKEEDYKAAF